MSEQVCETDNVLFRFVIVDSEEMPQIMGEYFLPIHFGSCAECFHAVKYVAAVNGPPCPGDKDTAGSDLPFPAVKAEFFGQLRWNQHLP